MRLSPLVLGVALLTALGCAGLFSTEGQAAGECGDGVDNDGNGLTDCAEGACSTTPACTGEADADTDTDSDTDSDSDSDTDTDADADFAFDVVWDGAGLTLLIDGPSGSYDFGMAEQTASGWYGEDCVPGPGPNSGSYDLCHSMRDGDTLRSVDRIEDLEAGETTLFQEMTSDDLAYVLIAQDGTCVSDRDGDGYYADELGCTEQ